MLYIEYEKVYQQFKQLQEFEKYLKQEIMDIYSIEDAEINQQCEALMENENSQIRA